MPEKHLRKIQSFVKREGRITPAQQRALGELWSVYGLKLEDGLLDLEKTFTRKADTVFEIGFGMGEGLLQYAQTEPDNNFIGVEVHRPGVGTLLNGIEKHGLKNLKIFKQDAIEILHDCISDNSLSRVQLFFPDPWHKKRHHKRRIVQTPFVNLLHEKLKVGGLLHMATDWVNYAEYMLDVLSHNLHFSNLSSTSDFVRRPESRPLTKFEQRGLRLGHGVWDLQFKNLGEEDND